MSTRRSRCAPPARRRPGDRDRHRIGAGAGPRPGPLGGPVAPYLWAARLDGDAKVSGVEADVDVSFKDTLEDLSFAGMAIVEARKGRFGFAVNPLFVRTESDARAGPAGGRQHDRHRHRRGRRVLPGGRAGSSAATAWASRGRWRSSPWSAPGSTICAARSTPGSTPPASRPGGRSTRARPGSTRSSASTRSCSLSERWAVRAEADIGGFGVGSDLTWNAQAVAHLPLHRGWLRRVRGRRLPGALLGLPGRRLRVGRDHARPDARCGGEVLMVSLRHSTASLSRAAGQELGPTGLMTAEERTGRVCRGGLIASVV